MKDFFFVLINEIRSYFVPEQMKYEITGKCLKCGKCCNHMYSYDTYTEKEFKIMQFLFPTYKRFYIKGKDVAAAGVTPVSCRESDTGRAAEHYDSAVAAGAGVEAAEQSLIAQAQNEGNLIFACKLVTKDGLCSVYKKRPRMCRKYPAKRILYPAGMHEGCGYKVNIKTFEDYL